MFKQESMYWLTGYDTFGFSSFQCMTMTADGRIALLNRAPDRGTAAYTSDVTDVRVYVDVDGMDPTVDLREMLADLGLVDGGGWAHEGARFRALRAVGDRPAGFPRSWRAITRSPLF